MPRLGAAPLSYAGIRVRRPAGGPPDHDDGPRDADAYGWARTAGTHAAAGDRSTAARSDPALPKQPPAPVKLPYCGSGPTATGRDGSDDHWDQEPAYSAAGIPATASASTSWAPDTPEPQ